MLETMELPTCDPHKLAHMYPNASADALDLMQKLLVFNPNKRLTAEEALSHPYVKDFHNIDDEPSAKEPIRISIDDNTKVSKPCKPDPDAITHIPDFAELHMTSGLCAH